MKVLDCSHNQISDLKSMYQLKGLLELNITYNYISDLKGIENLENLTHLYCYVNPLIYLKEIDKLKQLIILKSDITDDIEEARSIILSEIRIDKISDINVY